MTSNRTVHDQAATAPAEPSTTSFVHWCTLDGTGRALVCAACDVSWLLDSGETCWVCGEYGRRVGDLRAS